MSREEAEAGCSLLLNFHLQFITDVIKGGPELTKAVCLLSSAIEMVKHGTGFIVVQYHLRRVQALGRGNRDLELHIDFLRDCIHAMCANM